MSNRNTYLERVIDGMTVEAGPFGNGWEVTIRHAAVGSASSAIVAAITVSVDDAPLLVEKLQEAIRFIAAERAAGER